MGKHTTDTTEPTVTDTTEPTVTDTTEPTVTDTTEPTVTKSLSDMNDDELMAELIRRKNGIGNLVATITNKVKETEPTASEVAFMLTVNRLRHDMLRVLKAHGTLAEGRDSDTATITDYALTVRQPEGDDTLFADIASYFGVTVNGDKRADYSRMPQPTAKKAKGTVTGHRTTSIEDDQISVGSVGRHTFDKDKPTQVIRTLTRTTDGWLLDGDDTVYTSRTTPAVVATMTFTGKDKKDISMNGKRFWSFPAATDTATDMATDMATE